MQELKFIVHHMNRPITLYKDIVYHDFYDKFLKEGKSESNIIIDLNPKSWYLVEFLSRRYSK